MTRTTNDSWPADVIDTMRAMWLDGCSAGMIARVVCRSRSAVLGKLDRLGVKRHTARPRRSLAPVRLVAVKVAAPRPKPILVDVNAARALQPLGPQAIAERGFCKFMASDWELCCGRAIESAGAVYCNAHRAIAYRKQETAA